MSRFIDPFPSYTYEGDVVANGRLYFLEPGTSGFNSSDFKDTWSDPGFTTLNTNPVALDGDGRVPDIFLQGNYRVALFTVGGVEGGELVFDIDNYEGSPISEQFGEWSNTTNYGLGDYVTASDNFVYKSLQANNLNHNPISSATWWSQIAYISIYNANETYATDSVVLYQGILYTSLIDDNTGNTPSTSPSEWQSFSGSVNANSVSYDNTASGLTAADAQAAIDELQAGKQPLDADLTAIAALTTLPFGRSLLTATDAAAVLTLLGITSSIAELNYSNNVTSDIQSQLNAKQPIDSDLTAIAALTTTSFGRGLLTLADAAALLAAAGITATATEVNYTTNVTSDIQTQLNNKQPLDSDLTAIAAISTTSFGRGLLALADAAALANASAPQKITIGSSRDVATTDMGNTLFSGAPSLTLTLVSTAGSDGASFKLIANHAMTIAQGAGVTLSWLQGSGSSTAGNRTIAAYSELTITRNAATAWTISGNGIS